MPDMAHAGCIAASSPYSPPSAGRPCGAIALQIRVEAAVPEVSGATSWDWQCSDQLAGLVRVMLWPGTACMPFRRLRSQTMVLVCKASCAARFDGG